MSAPDSSDVTLALVDANVLACWESKVKLGLECSLLLKHSEGKITTTLQYSSSALPPPLSQAEKVNKKEQRRKKTKRSAKKFEALLAYQKRLVEEKGLPPSRLMLQQAAVNTSSCSPGSEPDKVSEELKCGKCDFSSKSKRGLKTHIIRTHKDTQDDMEVLRKPEEGSASPSASPLLDASREEVREEREEPVSPLRPGYKPWLKSPPTFPPTEPCYECFYSNPCSVQCGFPGYPE